MNCEVTENIEHQTANERWSEHGTEKSREPAGWKACATKGARSFQPFLLGLLVLVSLCGCASHKSFVGARPFDFQKDSFAYANELVWEYHFDADGKWVHQRREPQPDYTHHCFVVARSARQFFENARFDASLQPPTDEDCRKLIRRVVSIDPSHPLPDSKKIVIPGYTDLHDFSADREKLLKEECGGAWQSYFQRGHWRMIFPFSRARQDRTAEQLLADLKANCPPVVHVVRFPQLTINHAVMLFDAKQTEKEIVFSVYDPNKPESPKALVFDRATQTFTFAGNDYWPGGRVDIYEIYRTWNY
jgi:hypothetical protein